MKAQRGFSLIELMISLAIGLVLTGAILAVFALNTKTYETQNSYGRLQENARYALTTLQRDLRMAGYRGCAGSANNTPYTIKTANNLADPTSYLNNFVASVEAYEASANTWAPALDQNIAGATPPPSPGSDIITIRTGSGAGTPVTAPMANSAAAIPVASTSGIVAGTNAVIANCVYATVFQVTGLDAGPSLAHAAGAGNTTPNLSQAYSTDALVFPISTVTYYVAPSTNAPSATEKSLWRLANGTSTEIVEGVDDIQLLYGETASGAQSLAPDHYVTADAVTNMDNVVAVKISLLMRTLEDAVAATKQKYVFNGVPNITPVDHRVRRAFNLTVVLRNRTN